MLLKNKQTNKKTLKLDMWEYDQLPSVLSVVLLDVWLSYLVKCHLFYMEYKYKYNHFRITQISLSNIIDRLINGLLNFTKI